MGGCTLIDFECLLQGLASGGWFPLGDQPLPPLDLPPGQGVLLSSGGSSGGRKLCLQPLSNLDRSAAATEGWLAEIGIDARDTIVLNPLALHHVSGLMPWWRSVCWGAAYKHLEQNQMKNPVCLMELCQALPGWGIQPALLSLVPTQLARLMADPVGIAWLQQFAVIWVGGAALGKDLAEQARLNRIRLAPSYGSTETAAMVTALYPESFLEGVSGCGKPLFDVFLCEGRDGALKVRTSRLALCFWSEEKPDQWQNLEDPYGWWCSGDRAVITNAGLNVLGRLDGAINSGGETVFPEQLEQRLIAAAKVQRLQLDAVLLIGVADSEWGERIVALVKAKPSVILALKRFVQNWKVAERPKCWFFCPSLSVNSNGKWERRYWRNWIKKQKKRVMRFI